MTTLSELHTTLSVIVLLVLVYAFVALICKYVAICNSSKYGKSINLLYSYFSLKKQLLTWVEEFFLLRRSIKAPSQ